MRSSQGLPRTFENSPYEHGHPQGAHGWLLDHGFTELGGKATSHRRSATVPIAPVVANSLIAFVAKQSSGAVDRGQFEPSPLHPRPSYASRLALFMSGQPAAMNENIVSCRAPAVS
jgi:hypothetical protein